LRLGFDHERIHRPHLVDKHFRAGSFDNIANCSGERVWIAIGAQGPPGCSLMIHVTVSYVELFTTCFNQRCIALMVHHTNDLAPLRFRRADAIENAFADRGLIWECLGRQCSVDYE
jgi:hypothetical protein